MLTFPGIASRYDSCDKFDPKVVNKLFTLRRTKLLDLMYLSLFDTRISIYVIHFPISLLCVFSEFSLFLFIFLLIDC